MVQHSVLCLLRTLRSVHPDALGMRLRASGLTEKARRYLLFSLAGHAEALGILTLCRGTGGCRLRYCPSLPGPSYAALAAAPVAPAAVAPAAVPADT